MPAPPATEPTDEALAAHYRVTGAQEALGRLYGRYLELVYGVCLQYLRDGGRAEDAVQDIYEQLVDKLRRHDVSAFRPWLYRLARNHCLMLLRRKASRLAPGSTSVATYGDLDPADLDSGAAVVQAGATLHPSDDPEADDARAHEAQLEALADCTAALGTDQATCIRRFYLEGASYQDLADELGWSLNKVRSAIQNGRRNLRLCVARKLHHDPS